MKSKLVDFLRLFNNFMAFVYVIAGIFLIIVDIEFLSMHHAYKIILGIILLVYGFYRIYRVIIGIREQNEN